MSRPAPAGRGAALRALLAGLLLAGPVGAQGIGQLGPGVPPQAQKGPPVVALAAAPRDAAPAVAVAGAVDGSLLRVVEDGAAVKAEAVGKLPGASVAGLAWPAGAGPFALADDGRLFRVDLGAGEPTLLGRHPGGALCLAASPDGALLATGGVDGAVRLWAAADGAPRGALEGHAGPVAGLAFTPEALWSVGWDATVRTWDVGGAAATTRARSKGKPLTLGTRELTAVAVAAGGAQVLVAGHDGALHLVDARRRRPTPLPDRPHGEWARAVAVAPDGARAVAVLPAESALLHLDPAAPPRAVTVVDPRVPSAVAFLPDGRLLGGRFDGSVGLVELPDLPAAPGGKP